MTNDGAHDDRPDGATGRMSRRALLAAGAWSVPVITLATAAPAAAASGVLAWNWAYGTAFSPDGANIVLQAGFFLSDPTGSGASTTQITVTFTLPQPSGGGPGPQGTSGGGWSTPVTPERVGTNDVYTLVYPGSLTENTALPDVQLTVARIDLVGTEIPVTISSTNATGTANVITWG